MIQPVTVTNTGTSTINSWTVTFDIPAGHTVLNSGNQQFGFQVRRPSGNTQVPAAYTCTSP